MISSCAVYFLLMLIVYQSYGQVKMNSAMRSFSHAQKEGRCVLNEEVVLFKRTGPPGVITEQWFTGLDCFSGDSIIRYYIDDDPKPTIEGELFLMHGIGFYDRSQAKPWGNKWIGHLAADGAVYNTYRIPYQKSILVTLEAKKEVSEQYRLFWFILRGVENYPVVIGDLILPDSARLRLQKIERKSFDVYEFIPLATSKKNGLLFMTTLAGNSTDFNYLEGCFRVCTRNNTDVQYLSSGTEDFFLSAYYYNLGNYHTEHAGLTFLKAPGTMSAYKIFATDPVIFQDSFTLLWRQSERRGNACYVGKNSETCHLTEEGYMVVTSKDVDDEAPDLKNFNKPMFARTEISSYVWFYEW